MKHLSSLLVFALALATVSPASASTILYTNPGGVVDDTGFIMNIGSKLGGVVADKFTVAADSTVNEIDFLAWVGNGQPLDTVNFQIGSAPGTGAIITESIGDPLTSTPFTDTGNLHEVSVKITDLSIALTAGTYYLTLSGAHDGNGTFDVNWLGGYTGHSSDPGLFIVNTGGGADQLTNPGPASAGQQPGGWTNDFTILGTAGLPDPPTSPTPDVGSLFSMGGGLVALGVARFRRG